MAQPSPPSSQSLELQKLGSLPLCIAVDKSGSTIGQTIKAEVEVITQLCHLRRDPNQRPVTLLPWCDYASDVIELRESNIRRELRNIESGGGTDPSALYRSPSCLEAIRTSGIWTLMTDGQIQDSLVENFANSMAEVGVHNKACIIIVFGDTRQGRPATCDISVGIAVYAAVPDCLFLFHDVPTGTVRIMQAKGRFKQLLPVSEQKRPKLIVTMYTAWAELPRISYEDLFNIELGMIRALDRDEMALENGLIVNLPDVVAGKVDEATMQQIIRDRDNLKSIALAHKSRGTGKSLAAWLKAQMKPLPEKTAVPSDNNNAHQAVNELLEALRTDAPEHRLEELRQNVRFAHENNLRDFWRKKAEYEHEESVILHTNTRLQRHADQLDMPVEPTFDWNEYSNSVNTWSQIPSLANQNSDSYNSHTLNNCGYDSADGATTPPPEPVRMPKIAPKQPSPRLKHKRLTRTRRRSRVKDSSDKNSMISFDGENELDPVFLPCFHRQHPVTEYKGRCMLCHATSLLTLLLKSPPPERTENFPREDQHAKLAYPLAMGTFAELDILSPFLSCDACAVHLLQIGTSSMSDTIVGALPLVSLPENQSVWLESLDYAVKGRFDIADLMAICVAIIEAKLAENKVRNALPDEKDLFQDCAEWILCQLISIVEVPASLISPSPKTTQTTMKTLAAMLSAGHFQDPSHIQNKDLILLRYPISGFVVLLKLLCLRNLPSQQAQILLFQRIIFHVMEQYFARRMSAMPPHVVRSMLCLNDSSRSGNNSSNSSNLSPNEKTSISITEFMNQNLLDNASVSRLESCFEFDAVRTLGGPATAVFLHKLLRNGHAYSNATDCFNSFKVAPSMRTVIDAPMGIGSGLAADLISQL